MSISNEVNFENLSKVFKPMSAATANASATNTNMNILKILWPSIAGLHGSQLTINSPLPIFLCEPLKFSLNMTAAALGSFWWFPTKKGSNGKSYFGLTYTPSHPSYFIFVYFKLIGITLYPNGGTVVGENGFIALR